MNEGQPGRTGLVGMIGDATGLTIPAVFATFAAGASLASTPGASVRVKVEPTAETRHTYNILAESSTGDDSNTPTVEDYQLTGNINRFAFDVNADAVATAVFTYAFDTSTLPPRAAAAQVSRRDDDSQRGAGQRLIPGIVHIGKHVDQPLLGVPIAPDRLVHCHRERGEPRPHIRRRPPVPALSLKPTHRAMVPQPSKTHARIFTRQQVIAWRMESGRATLR